MANSGNTEEAEKAEKAEESSTVAATNDSRADQVGDGVICRLEKKIGSHRSRKVCRTVEEIEANMRRTQGGMLRGSRTGSASGGADGGN